MRFAAERYAADVLGGRVVACRWVRLACERYVADKETGAARGLQFDEQAARMAIAFFGVLHHWKGEWAGQPIKLEPWQQFIIWNVFGWRRADGLRRFRTVYLEVARKNGKTTLAGGIGLYLAFVDNEPGAEVYSVATKRDQARISHQDATQMVRRSPQLRQEVTVFRDNLHSRTSASKFEPLGSDKNTLDGLNVHGVIADEVHAWPDGGLWDVMETATGARRQPLMIAITTAGYDRHSFCYGLHDYAEKVLGGVVSDDSFFGMIYTLDAGDAWEDEALWVKANPNLGVSKKLDDIRRLAGRAREMPARLNAFLRLHLNVWTQAETRWIDGDKWRSCGTRPVPAEAALAGRRCYGGLDLSTTTDISAWVLVFPPAEEGELWWVLVRLWLPAENLQQRVSRDRVPYDAWSRAGLLTLTPGNVVDYDWIETQIRTDAAQFDLVEVAFDPWNATSVTNHLAEEGLELVEFRQGFVTMNPAMRALEVAIAQGVVGHGNHPALAWMADNLVAAQDPAGNIKPDKNKSRERIDGMVALIMAHQRAVLGNKSRESVYEGRGLRVL